MFFYSLGELLLRIYSFGYKGFGFRVWEAWVDDPTAGGSAWGGIGSEYLINAHE